jgi:hypothetical protein
VAQFVGSRVMLVLIGGWLITGGVIPSVAAKNDACRVGCKTEKQACRDAYQGAFQTTKSDCTGSGKAKRQCVKTARSVLRAGVKKCRGFAATCLACCKAGGTNCNVQCGDGVVSGSESCDPPGSSGCAGGGACNESCRCPSVVTTTSLATATTSAPSTTTTTTTSSSTSTIPPPCGNGVKDGDETAVDCGGGTCAPCADGLACTKGGDCRSRFCSGENVCTDPCPTQPAGTPCADDDNSCTDDSCDGSTCQHTPLDGIVCRRAAGPCDAAEVCDGSGDPCPPDQLLSDGEVCRPRQGGCDEEEECNGSSPECPPDKLTQEGFPCRLARGVCDVAETCSGTDAACPPDGILGPEAVCRSVYGVCDVAETCDGSSKDCPEDGFQIGTVCRSSAGVCDVAETCVGDPDCPLDAFLPSSTVCRSAAGGCDPAEMCTGSGAACPANAFLPSGTVCRSAAGKCDVTEVCDGSHASCPQNRRLPSTTICRPSAGPCDIADHCSGGDDCESDLKEKSNVICRSQTGPCDVADHCDGTSSACADAVTSSGTVCRSANGVCDVAETCDGVKHDCPADQFKSSGTVCRPSKMAEYSVCDAAESCTGASTACPPDVVAPNSTVCVPQDPTNPCDDDILCHDGFCSVDIITVDTGRICRPVPLNRAGYCDIPEYCVQPFAGAPGICPPDEIKPKGTICLKTPNDYCHQDVECTGSSKACAPSLAKVEPDGIPCLDLQTHTKPGVCGNGTCILFGARCTVGGNPTGCAKGQGCANCAADGAPPEGYCVDAERPCCSAGAFTDVYFWCGETELGNGQRVLSQCCNFKCAYRDEDQHCGTCDRNCLGDTVGPPDSTCYFQPFGGRCDSSTGHIQCTGPSIDYPNQVCLADGTVWTWNECDDDADCPSDAICGSAAHDDECGSNRATYGQCVRPYEFDPDPYKRCYAPLPCQQDTDCTGYPLWSCQPVYETDPDTYLLSYHSYCKWGQRCVHDTDCASGFCLLNDLGLAGNISGICSAADQKEGTFVSIEVSGVSTACYSDGECPSGVCMLGCGGSSVYAQLCTESGVCAP